MALSDANTPTGFPMQLPDNRNIAELVDFTFAQNHADLPHAAKVSNIASEFGITPAAAELTLDRVAGGIVLAAFGDNLSSPDSRTDPIAYHSFQRTIARRQQATA